MKPFPDGLNQVIDYCCFLAEERNSEKDWKMI